MILDAAIQLAGTYHRPTNGWSPVNITALGITACNAIDAGPSPASQPVDIGGGQSSVELTISIVQTLTSAGAATVQFQLVQADDAALATNAQVLVQTEPLAYTLLTQGKRVSMRWGSATPLPAKRYQGLRVVIAGAALTNASGWLLAGVGGLHHDTGADGRGPIFKSGFSVV